ncbi:hypothetical protein QAD02_020272 [Eretmocerus hayati]|uniref:Uncharacterized protein n=1 Tax=Eretmocerus hayati TaxID=131215 RepID=A0ACC2PRR1_9HYME|nr:hypothetical protein QAD02_020272 [Eretmocerus hayati]
MKALTRWPATTVANRPGRKSTNRDCLGTDDGSDGGKTRGSGAGHAGDEGANGGGGSNGSGGGFGANCCKKYVVLCCLCGGLSSAVGCLFLAVHAVLSAHTASLALFETVPSYIPGTMLIFMGLFTMLLARRKHRYGFLMKVCGSISVVCALVCVLVTVTTTVVHMSRLQGLRECFYTPTAKSCTCQGAPQSRASDTVVLFEGTSHCNVVQGALYACLRALFGVSVAGILACIFSCMLIYQLLSHEKKKMYWEQLELRCRSLYGQGGSGAALVATAAAAAAAGPRHLGGPNGLATHAPGAPGCSCCGDCTTAVAAASVTGPWWAHSPGNLYTPNPDQLAPARRWRLPCAGPYGVIEAALPLWGPPPPYSDPNSPARRPNPTTAAAVLAAVGFPSPGQDPCSRPRLLAKKIEPAAYPLREVDYARSSEVKRLNGNYENTERVSIDTDTEPSENTENRTSRGSKHRKLLKGVENAAFQPHEPSTVVKQPDSDIYFGDVSSCCGPESSLYEVAMDNEGKSELTHSSSAGSQALAASLALYGTRSSATAAAAAAGPERDYGLTRHQGRSPDRQQQLSGGQGSHPATAGDARERNASPGDETHSGSTFEEEVRPVNV